MIEQYKNKNLLISGQEISTIFCGLTVVSLV